MSTDEQIKDIDAGIYISNEGARLFEKKKEYT